MRRKRLSSESIIQEKLFTKEIINQFANVPLAGTLSSPTSQ